MPASAYAYVARPSREQVELLGLGTAPRRIARKSRPRGECVFWQGALVGRVPQISITAGGISWREQVTHVVFRLARGRWPVGVVRSCLLERCIADCHLVEASLAEASARAVNVQRVLSDEQVQEVRRSFLAGGSMAELAREWGVHHSTVYRAARYWSYPNVGDG